MKNLLLILALITIGTHAYCEEFLLTSERPIKAIYVRNDDIIKAEPLYTIDNSKENFILTAKNDGKTLLLVNLYDKEIFIDAKVKKGEITIDETDGFNLLSIDHPPKEVELIPPWVNGGKWGK